MKPRHRRTHSSLRSHFMTSQTRTRRMNSHEVFSVASRDSRRQFANHSSYGIYTVVHIRLEIAVSRLQFRGSNSRTGPQHEYEHLLPLTCRYSSCERMNTERTQPRPMQYCKLHSAGRAARSVHFLYEFQPGERRNLSAIVRLQTPS